MHAGEPTASRLLRVCATPRPPARPARPGRLPACPALLPRPLLLPCAAAPAVLPRAAVAEPGARGAPRGCGRLRVPPRPGARCMSGAGSGQGPRPCRCTGPSPTSMWRLITPHPLNRKVLPSRSGSGATLAATSTQVSLPDTRLDQRLRNTSAFGRFESGDQHGSLS